MSLSHNACPCPRSECLCPLDSGFRRNDEGEAGMTEGKREYGVFPSLSRFPALPSGKEETLQQPAALGLAEAAGYI